MASVITSKASKTLVEPREDWNWGFESNSGNKVISEFFCLLISYVGGGLWMGQPSVWEALPIAYMFKFTGHIA
jgi:hypothetical protein